MSALSFDPWGVLKRQREDAALAAAITDENMLGCIEELRELFLRRRIAADCTLVLPGLTVDFRLEGPAPEADYPR